ncbi:MAG TPA: DUF5977 domain-containing protein [Puia sp.]|jgi:YD repeat-containing protein
MNVKFRKLVRTILFVVFVLSRAKTTWAQVDLPSGSASFNIPIFHWEDDKSRLSMPIALNYSSGSGLKVNSIPTNVGQGWELQLGGVVSRMQVGEPDDQQAYGQAAPEDVTKYPDGYLYNNVDIALGCPKLLSRYPIYKDKNHLYKEHNPVIADKELDHFAFQFNGRSGILVVKKDNTAIFLGDTKMKAWFTTRNMTSSGIRTTIDAFYIQDENGLIYKFAQLDLAKELKSKFCDVNEVAAKTQPDMKGQHVYNQSSFDDNDASNPLTKPLVNPWVVTGWFLSNISDPLTGRTVTFNYSTQPLLINNSVGFAFSYYSHKDYDVITHSISMTKTPQLLSVDYPDDHHVVLHYGAARADLNGDVALAAIDVLYHTRYISEHQLTTSYFIQNRYGTPVSPFQKQSARLCLQSVRRLGVDLMDEEPPYKFDYYLGSAAADDFVPPPFFYMKDIWGFYNGSQSVDALNNPIDPTTPGSRLNFQQVKGLCYMRANDPNPHLLNAKPGYAKNGLLKQVIYPTGGMLTYQYDQNKATINGQYVDVGGVHVSGTRVSDGGFSNGCGNPITSAYYYTKDRTHAESSLMIIESPRNNMAVSTNVYDPESPYFYYRFPFHLGCDYHFKYPGILQTDQAVSLSANQQFWQAFFKVVDVLGAIMDVMDVVNVCLDATPAAIIAVALDVIGVVVEIIFSCTANLHQENMEMVYYSSDVNAANPLPASFTTLEVVEGSGTDGSVVYEFTSPVDYPVWIPDNTDNLYNSGRDKFTMEQRFPYWAYGQPKKVTHLDPSGNKVKETENIYDPTNLQQEYSVFDKEHPFTVTPQSCKCDLALQTSSRNDSWADPVNYDPATTFDASYISADGVLPYFYGYYHGRLPLATTYERTYKPGDAQHYQQTETDYTYNRFNFQPNFISTTQSNGDITSKTMTYPVDYEDQTTVLYKMVQNNIVNDVISSYSAVYKPAIFQTFLLDEKVTEYATAGLGEIKAVRTLEQRFSKPQPSVVTYQGPGAATNPVYRQTAAFTYDGADNLIKVIDEGGRVTTNIYDYADKYVTASIINADPIVDKPAYTSFETSTLGGWTAHGTGAPQTGPAATGSWYLALTPGASLTATINSAKPYILSFWATSGSVAATGTLVKAAPTIRGYTYYEYRVPQGTGSVTVSGNSNIDELRLYPVTARLRSVTFDPLVGKTSECDANNRISYYEYDGIGRLRLIKDEFGNIIKMYEYNYANNNQSSCILTYYNNAISEPFVKQNCAANTTGKAVTYNIPANKYSSTISQGAADQQAQAELDALGQVNADNQTQANACVAIWYNGILSQSFASEACPEGYKGSPVTYTVPANRYSSLISPGDAQQQAQDEIDANGQAYANAMPNTCVVDTAGDWNATGVTQCLPNGHMSVQFKDMNFNSPSYNQTMNVDTGANASCPIGPPPTIYARLYYTNGGSMSSENTIYNYSDIVVRFFHDQAGTQPYSVTNLDVNVSVSEDCDDGTNTFYILTANSVSGTEVTVAYSQYLATQYFGTDGNGNPADNLCLYRYSVYTGNYVIIP